MYHTNNTMYQINSTLSIYQRQKAIDKGLPFCLNLFLKPTCISVLFKERNRMYHSFTFLSRCTSFFFSFETVYCNQQNIISGFLYYLTAREKDASLQCNTRAWNCSWKKKEEISRGVWRQALLENFESRD